jgi:hypothetical protein
MIPKTVFAAAVCSVLLASSGLSRAEEYRPGEYLGLDLSRALFSPKPLGPRAEFAPVRLQAMSDPGSEAARPGVHPTAAPGTATAGTATPKARMVHGGARAAVGTEPKAGPKVTTRTTGPAQRSAAAGVAPKAGPELASRKTAIAHMTASKPHSAVRPLVTRNRGNPLDAQAFDARVQVWPCKSGGICNWKR